MDGMPRPMLDSLNHNTKYRRYDQTEVSKMPDLGGARPDMVMDFILSQPPA
jgi:hypothetical protein